MLMMTKDIEPFLNYLDELFPHVKCELNYSKDYELAIAVMLSAQTTDASVNRVTKELFNKYPNLESYKNATLKDIEDIIHSIGLYQNKAKNILGITSMLINDFNGVLPSDKNELMKLPGIGNKSAGVIRIEIFKIPDLPVDTHVARVSKRLGFALVKDEPIDIEKRLKKLIEQDRWIKTHHQMIHFGRYFCLAKNPHCSECKMRDFCCKN